MNTSARTVPALREFASSAPAEAATYLSHVETRLRGAGKTAEADALAAVLRDGMGTLAERVERHQTRLTGIFPAQATDWGRVQLERAQTIGYGAPASPPAEFLRGTVKADAAGNAVLTTDGGRQLTLTTSDRALPKAATVQLSLISGFLNDGPIALQGTFGEDGTSFNVEGFALDTDGSFKTFTFGRVDTDGSSSIHTPRGKVDIDDATLDRKLSALPGLAVILPGTAEQRGNALVYTGAPKEFFALSRWSETHRPITSDVVTLKADMAYSVFDDGPVNVPAAYAERATHIGRVWLRGDVTIDRRGNAKQFDASYASTDADSRAVAFGPSVLDADPVQAAVMHEVE